MDTTILIFVKVDGAMTLPMDVSLSDKVGDIARRIPNSAGCSQRDVYVTSEGRLLKGSEDLRSCGISDGSTVQVTSRMRGGGKHKDAKTKTEKKRAASPERQRRSDKGSAAKGKVLRSCEAAEVRTR